MNSKGTGESNHQKQVLDKAEHPLSFADCFAVDTARKNNAVIMTGDPEFKKIDQLVEIEWLD